jgi:hypothetical protein
MIQGLINIKVASDATYQGIPFSFSSFTDVIISNIYFVINVLLFHESFKGASTYVQL